MAYADKLNEEQQEDARITGIAFGWELSSLLIGDPTCVAACEHCEGLAVVARYSNVGFGFMPPEVKAQWEAETWYPFRVKALMACCEHFLDYMAYKGIFCLPTERVKDYASELQRESDCDVCDVTGIAFGMVDGGSMIGGCEYCGYAVRAPRHLVEAHGVRAIAEPLRIEMGKAAEKKTCAHYFRWLKSMEVSR